LAKGSDEEEEEEESEDGLLGSIIYMVWVADEVDLRVQ
jgi:hypothetical protein